MVEAAMQASLLTGSNLELLKYMVRRSRSRICNLLVAESRLHRLHHHMCKRVLVCLRVYLSAVVCSVGCGIS